MATPNRIAHQHTVVQISLESPLQAWLDGCPHRSITITSGRLEGIAATLLEHGRVVHAVEAEDPESGLQLLGEAAAELSA